MFVKFFKGRFNKKKIPDKFTTKNNINIKETMIYIMTNKRSIKPENEMRITYEEKLEIDQSTGKERLMMKNLKKFKVSEIRSFRPKIFQQNFMKKLLIKTFYPRDYPYSVKEGYYGFTKNSFISSICFNSMGFIATQIMINCLGIDISENKKFAFSAGMNWVIKDCIGQIGSIFFATKFANKIEINMKEWRMKGLFLLNLSILIELMVILSPQHFLIIASLGNIVKFASLTVLMVTRADIINHFSKDNTSDMTQKLTSQGNFSMFLGNLLGFALSLIFPINNPFFSIPIIAGISAINIIHCYRSVNFIHLNIFNTQRMYLFCEEYLNNLNISTPNDIARKEKIFSGFLKNVHFGTNCLNDIISREKNDDYISYLLDIFRNKKFFCYVKKHFMKKEYDYYIFLRLDVSNEDKFYAFFYLVKLKLFFDKVKEKKSIPSEKLEFKNCLKEIEMMNTEKFFNQMQSAGWNMDFNYLEERYCRYHILEVGN